MNIFDDHLDAMTRTFIAVPLVQLPVIRRPCGNENHHSGRKINRSDIPKDAEVIFHLASEFGE
jgi:hypothetical protein